jgi:hypothetical protein
MLHVQNSFRTNSAWLRDADPSETPSVDEVRIDFANQSSLYARQEAIKLVAIQVLLTPEFSVSSGNVIHLTKCDSEMFKMISALILEKKHLFEVIADGEMYPTIFEELSKHLRMYHPMGCDPVIARVEEEMAYMSLNQARKILADFAKMDPVPTARPVAVKIASQIHQAAKLASSDDEAESMLAMIRAYSIEQHHCDVCLEKLQLEMGSVISTQKDLIDNQILILRAGSAECKEKISKLKQQFYKDIEHLRMFDLYLLSQRDDQNDPELKEIIASCKKKLEDYKNDLLNALRRSGSHLERSDLLEYLVGPKAFLFDSYQLRLNPNPPNLKYPFRHSSTSSHFGYQLENDGPMELEEEIRTDLMSHAHMALFPPIIKERTFTKPINEKAKKMQADLLPILQRWMTASEEEVERVKQELINHNDWGKYCIEPVNLRLYETKNPTETSTLRGQLTKFARRYEFVFKPTDFDMFLVRPDGRVCPDKVGVQEILAEEARYSSAVAVPR